jgi:two-component system, NtrC family, response regulator GlrR
MSEHSSQSHLAESRVASTTPDRSATGADGNPTSGIARATGRRRSDRIISASALMQEVVDQASAVARGDGLVVIAGQSGSGRKHVARAIHQWSPRAGGPLVEVQFAGTSEPAQTRELFGDGSNPGALSRGQGGTVLLESADQLSPNTLTRLADALRASSGSGTRARLLATVAEGAHGALAPLDGDRIQIAALSMRSEDILPLAAHFLAEFAAEEGVEPIGFTADARRWLVEETWPGNVRELRERIRQAIRLAGQGAVSAEALMLSTEGEDVPSFKDAKRAFETRYVEGLLRRCSGNISRAARMAKKDRKDFYDVIRRTGVDPGQFRG